MWVVIVAAAAGVLLGEPRVIDGDTLRDGAERYRVENLDAPELDARARCPAEAMLAAAARNEALRPITQANRVEAILSGRRDVYGRIVARIEIDGRDLGEALIADGLALPWRGRGADYCAR